MKEPRELDTQASASLRDAHTDAPEPEDGTRVRIRLAFQEFYSHPGPILAEKYLERWYAGRSGAGCLPSNCITPPNTFMPSARIYVSN